jgi:hypothetical protein
MMGSRGRYQTVGLAFHICVRISNCESKANPSTDVNRRHARIGFKVGARLAPFPRLMPSFESKRHFTL